MFDKVRVVNLNYFPLNIKKSSLYEGVAQDVQKDIQRGERTVVVVSAPQHEEITAQVKADAHHANALKQVCKRKGIPAITMLPDQLGIFTEGADAMHGKIKGIDMRILPAAMNTTLALVVPAYGLNIGSQNPQKLGVESAEIIAIAAAHVGEIVPRLYTSGTERLENVCCPIYRQSALYTAPPDIVTGAKILPVVTYEDARTLSEYIAPQERFMALETIKFAQQRDVPLSIVDWEDIQRNTKIQASRILRAWEDTIEDVSLNDKETRPLLVFPDIPFKALVVKMPSYVLNIKGVPNTPGEAEKLLELLKRQEIGVEGFFQLPDPVEAIVYCLLDVTLTRAHIAAMETQTIPLLQGSFPNHPLSIRHGQFGVLTYRDTDITPQTDFLPRITSCLASRKINIEVIDDLGEIIQISVAQQDTKAAAQALATNLGLV